MLSLLILFLAFALFIYGCFYIWPNRSLWFLLEWQNRQHYRVHFDGADYQLNHSMFMIARTPTLYMASLLKRLTLLPVYCINMDVPSSHSQQRFLKNAQIKFIKLNAFNQLTQPGLFLISSSDYAQLAASLPASILYLAGSTLPGRARMRWSPRDLQLSLQRLDSREVSLDICLQRLSVHAWERYVDKLPSIIESWLDQAKALGNRLSVADATGLELSHHRLLAGVLSMHHKLFKPLAGCQYVGLCLPNSVAGTLALLSTLSLGKTIVNLNYTADQASLTTAIQATGLQTVITSKLFVAQLRKKGFPIEAMFNLVTPIYLEDIKAEISKQELIKSYVLIKIMPTAFLRALLVPPVASTQVAFVLFSSGSEGKPKGVELTHRNIIGNVRQAAEVLAAQADDVLLSVLPTFHAFGLTAGTLLPLMEGFSMVSHPDPTDTATIGVLAQQYQATMLFATSTFLRLYAKAKNISPQMFASLRIIVAGAERLQPEVRVLFEEKFKKIIYEGYGTTELSPVATVNRPDTPLEIRQKIGSVGKPIAGCMIRIIDPDTGESLPQGMPGLILVGGVNVMKGYLHDPDKTNQAIIYEQGIRWYKTGDKGRLDEHGFLTILDRYSRFAKIGGEAVSLGAVEQQIMLMLDQAEIEILALAVPDPKKGEMIVLLFSGPMSSEDLQNKVLHSHMHNLMKPQKYFYVERIPKLGTGKTDFAGAKALALLKLNH